MILHSPPFSPSSVQVKKQATKAQKTCGILKKLKIKNDNIKTLKILNGTLKALAVTLKYLQDVAVAVQSYLHNLFDFH
jgi:hypothetical protein